MQLKARKEVIRIFGDDHSDILPTLEQLQGLDYINMVIKEVSFWLSTELNILLNNVRFFKWIN